MNTTLESWFRWATASGEDEGQGMVEYALILVLIAIACIAALTFGRSGCPQTLGVHRGQSPDGAHLRLVTPFSSNETIVSSG